MSSEEHGRTVTESVREISESENLQSMQPQSLDDEIKMRVEECNKSQELNWNLTRMVEQGQRECDVLRSEVLDESQRQALEMPKLPVPGSSKEGLTVEMLRGLQKIMDDFERIEHDHSNLTLQAELPSLESKVRTQMELASEMKAAYEMELKEYLNRPSPQESSLDTLLKELRVEKLRLDEKRIAKKEELKRAWFFAPPSCPMPRSLQQKE